MYIISFSDSLYKPHKYEILIECDKPDVTEIRSKRCKRIEAWLEKPDFFGAMTQKKGNRFYHIEYLRKEYEVICPEYRVGGEKYIVIPDYILPRKKYPVCVYLYALYIYCTNKEMGQRAAAAATREKFKLKTFSHTTLGRTLRALEESIKTAERDSVIDNGKDDNNADGVEEAADGQKKRHFPTKAETYARRERIKSFLSVLRGKKNAEDIYEASREIVAAWYDKYRRLLL